MIKFAKDAELLPDSSPDGHDRKQEEVKAALESVQGILAQRANAVVPQAAESRPLHEEERAVRTSLEAGNRSETPNATSVQPEQVPPELAFPLEATSTQAATGIETPVYPTLDSDIRTVAKTGLVGAGVGAAALGGATALELAAAGAPTAAIATAGGLSALAGAWNVGLGVAGTYVGGMLHKLVWDTPPDKSGFLQTMGRGIIAPVSVPVGVLYRVFRKK